MNYEVIEIGTDYIVVWSGIHDEKHHKIGIIKLWISPHRYAVGSKVWLKVAPQNERLPNPPRCDKHNTHHKLAPSCA